MKKIRIFRGYRVGYPRMWEERRLLYLAPTRTAALRWAAAWKLHKERKKTVPLYFVEVKGIDVTKQLRIDIFAPPEKIIKDPEIIRLIKIKEISAIDYRKYAKKKLTTFNLMLERSKFKEGVLITIKDKKFLYDTKFKRIKAIINDDDDLRNVKIVKKMKINPPEWWMSGKTWKEIISSISKIPKRYISLV